MLGDVLDHPVRNEVPDGFPVLDEAFGSTVPGLYVAGFATTRDWKVVRDGAVAREDVRAALDAVT